MHQRSENMGGVGVRYDKLETILQIAFDMQGSAEGVSLADIKEKFGVSIRTAERLRDAVLRAFPHAEEVETGERRKRWRMPGRGINTLVSFSADEFASLAAAVRVLNRENMPKHGEVLRQLTSKLQALNGSKRALNVDPDLEALIEAEGLAMRPGPRPKIDPAVLEALRQAVLARHEVTLHYRSRSTGRRSRQRVWPYGFLYGSRHYLVAYSPDVVADLDEEDGFRLFSLPNIAKVETVAIPFVRDPAFNLKTYAERSFGVFQEDPVDVEWRFAKEVADEAREFLFYPSQTMKSNPDGSLTVTFRAGGLLEMSWHLFTWGNKVKVIKPRALSTLTKQRP